MAKYPTGIARSLILRLITITYSLLFLDIAVASTATPAINSHFQSLVNVSWYGSKKNLNHFCLTDQPPRWWSRRHDAVHVSYPRARTHGGEASESSRIYAHHPRSRHVPNGVTVRRQPVRVEQLSRYRLLNWYTSHNCSISGLGAPLGRRGHGAILHADTSHHLVSSKNYVFRLGQHSCC